MSKTKPKEVWSLTSIKVLDEIYSTFKQDGKDSNITLQKLVNRSMYLFATYQGFKDKIKGTEILSEDYKTGY